MVMGEERRVLPHVKGNLAAREKIDVVVDVALIHSAHIHTCYLTLSGVL